MSKKIETIKAEMVAPCSSSYFCRVALFSMLWVFLLITACSSSYQFSTAPQPLDTTYLPRPNVATTIPFLGPCTDSENRTIHFNSNHPMTIMVHGINGAAGNFRSLSQLYALHGKQSVCFNYDSRNSLVDSSEKLIAAINKLSGLTNAHNLSIIGYSFGGLIVRKAVEQNNQGKWPKYKTIELITVSTPFAGIRSATNCGYKLMHWLSLGSIPIICQIISGDNWYEIAPNSDFIKLPQPLMPAVQQYIKIVTNEEGSCRFKNNGHECIESDHVMSLSEQYHPVIDNYPQTTHIQIDSGHTAIIGSNGTTPDKLLSILNEYSFLRFDQTTLRKEKEAAIKQ